jgi:hypothetical protein
MLFMKSSTHFVDYYDWLKEKGCRAPAAGEPKQGNLPSDEDLN